MFGLITHCSNKINTANVSNDTIKETNLLKPDELEPITEGEKEVTYDGERV